MFTRREVLKASGFVIAGLASGVHKSYAKIIAPASPGNPYPWEESKRPLPKDRHFVSESVEATIDRMKKNIVDEELAWLFENCFPNTLDTTVEYREEQGEPDTFVITGDIEAMWLRDSSAQVWPYIPLIRDDKKLARMIAGVVNRQTKCILIDPYANAFNFAATGSEWESDLTDMKKELHERKWEIDSLCYPIRLAYGYWKASGDASVFSLRWREAMKLIVKTFREQQRYANKGPYHFMRTTAVSCDTVPLGGYGNPTRSCGMIHSMFRPSDDSCIFPLLTSSNLFAIVSLRQLGEIFSNELREKDFSRECIDLADVIERSVHEHALGHVSKFGTIYSYEIDGFGNKLFMDDANVPSLLSLPYLGCCASNDPLYQNTRAFVLSEDNPYFFKGKSGEGIGGPHVGLSMIWPIGIIMRALTSSHDGEIAHCLHMLKNTHAGTGFMHESFDKDDSSKFTRNWFAWANTLFGELLVTIDRERPSLLKRAY